MPTFLLHGFRWPRALIRVHIILQNLDDAAAEWLMAPKTSSAMLNNFHELYPECMDRLPRLRFIEQYDPSDLSANAASQPYAYVADLVEEVKLGVEIDEVRGRGLNNDQWTAIMELRDKLAPEEKVGWFIVVCGDEERLAPAIGAGAASATSSSVRGSDSDGYSNGVAVDTQAKPQTPTTAEPKGLRKLFGSARLGRRKSTTITTTTTTTTTYALPTGPNGGAVSPPVAERHLSEIAVAPPVRDATPRSTTPDLADFEFKTKYRRSSQIPDYRNSFSDLEPAPPTLYQPVFAPKPAIEDQILAQPATASAVPKPWVHGGSSPRKVSEPPRPWNEQQDSPRRNSELMGQTRSPRNLSPSERRRTFAGGAYESNVVSAASSAFPSRSQSPSGRYSRIPSGAVSPIVRDLSPAPARRLPSPLAAPIGNRHSAPSMQAIAPKRAQGLSLNTQVHYNPPSGVQTPAAQQLQQQLASPVPEEEDEEEEDMAEVITLSPVVKSPITRHRQSRASSIVMPLDAALPPINAGASIIPGSLMSGTAFADADKPYFGQNITSTELLANNIEAAFDSFDRL